MKKAISPQDEITVSEDPCPVGRIAFGTPITPGEPQIIADNPPEYIHINAEDEALLNPADHAILTPTRKALLDNLKAPTHAVPDTEILRLLKQLPLINKIGYFTEKTARKVNYPGQRDLGLYVEALLPEELQETQDALFAWSENKTPETMNELVDGFADVAYLAIAGMYMVFRDKGHAPEYAAHLVQKFLSAVADANNMKYPFNKNSVGKVQKPEGWTKPDTLHLCGGSDGRGAFDAVEKAFKNRNPEKPADE